MNDGLTERLRDFLGERAVLGVWLVDYGESDLADFDRREQMMLSLLDELEDLREEIDKYVGAA